MASQPLPGVVADATDATMFSASRRSVWRSPFDEGVGEVDATRGQVPSPGPGWACGSCNRRWGWGRSALVPGDAPGIRNRCIIRSWLEVLQRQLAVPSPSGWSPSPARSRRPGVPSQHTGSPWASKRSLAARLRCPPALSVTGLDQVPSRSINKNGSSSLLPSYTLAADGVVAATSRSTWSTASISCPDSQW